MGSDRKQDIIRAAQEVFAEYGLTDAKMSDIAKKAGVVDSIIYHYFKNKEDLLFHSLSEKAAQAGKEVKFHLEGILDPVSRLGKMIWFHLYLNDVSPMELRVIKNLLFECRANKAFYSHSGYKPLQNYMKIVNKILEQGVESKVFRNDFNVNLVRTMIFGLLDEESLNFVSHEVDETMPDFEGIMDLILAIVLRDEGNGAENTAGEDDKMQRVLVAAERIFAKKGYRAATMAEIANEARVAEGTIYTYFENKQDLLFSLPQKRIEWLRTNMDEAFKVNDPLSKLYWFIRLFFRTFLSQPDFLKVFLLDIKLNRKFYESKAYKPYLYYISAVGPILDAGKEKGFIREKVNNRIFRNLLVGSFTQLTTRWFILENATAKEMMLQWDQVVNMLCRSVIKRDVMLNFS
ncbi:Transcriptional regulator, TetR family [uncultured Desulfobacterium sp.]|uniref:Transcriptional regulator, TetR family n=1 Tax=uncultured Desulfobacterium sp. TaxID=201089 RepID=A0A445MYV0_9BACT|nr:Transcriptional regulator, TetR family [uncultured Desulfobacterium sp.]